MSDGDGRTPEEPGTPGGPVAPEEEAEEGEGDSAEPGEPADRDGDGERREREERYVALIPEEDAGRLASFAERLDAIRAAAPRLRLDTLVERVAVDMGLDLAALMREGGVRRVANARKLMRLAREFEATEGRDLRGFLDHLDDRATTERPESQAAVRSEAHDGVRIMTIHAAKGLEFPVVAVADLGRESRPVREAVLVDPDGNGGGRLGLRLPRLDGPPMSVYAFDELRDRTRAEGDAEERRLVHVAMTRARRRLILSGVHDLSRPLPADRPGLPAMARILAALGASREDDEVVEVPAPLPREGLDASFQPGRVAVRLHRPGQLSLHLETEAPARAGREVGAPTAPALPPPAPDRPAVGHLSYSALDLYERCGYRFYAERVLGLARPDGDRGGSPRDRPAAPAGARESGLALGESVHELLEWSARNRWARPRRERCESLLRARGIEGEGPARRALSLLEAWLDSPLRAELATAGTRVRPEVPFLVEIEERIVRGNIDLLAEPSAGAPLVLDYKTDALGGRDAAAVAERYVLQRDLYAIAAAQALGVGEVRTAFVFLEAAGEPVSALYGASELTAARRRVTALLAAIREGRFAVTSSPHRGLCHDCPARPRLCSHPREATLAPEPA